MNARFLFVSVVVSVLPLEVNVPEAGGGPDGDSSKGSGPSVSFDLLGGGGSYSIVPRSCSGNAIGSPTAVPFREVAGAVEIAGEHVSVGVRGGLLHIQGDEPPSRGWPVVAFEQDIWYLNPYFGLDSKYLGIGAGIFCSSEELPATELDETIPISGHLRLGPPVAHFKISVMEGLPVATGGGYIRIGAGFAPRPQDAFFVGLSIEPYDGAGLAGSMDLSINERISVLARTRVGTTEGQFEGGLALGLRWSAR